MDSRHPIWVLIILPVIIFSNGCLYNNVREIEPDTSFHGLDHIYNSGGNTLNVVFVHGMGDHPFGEPELLDYQMKIAEELGFGEDKVQGDVSWGANCRVGFERYVHFSKLENQRLIVRQEKNQEICPLKINDVVVGFIGWRQYRSPDSGKVLNLFELSWDRATELLQKTLLELDDEYYETIELDEALKPIEGGRNREADRAFVNRWLKKFVNQNLGDPAIYLGSYGDSIRQVVAEGLSKIAAVAGTDSSYSYSIVSDSMGSRIVFDALGCALDNASGKVDAGCEYLRTVPKSTDIKFNNLKRVATKTAQVFMNANQLPFLALSNVRPPLEGETEEKWLNRYPCESGGPGLVRYLQGRKLLKDTVQIVAFTDPNDALSYHLTERFRKKCTHLGGSGYKRVEFINVRIANVHWDFGIFANPLKAHSGGFRTNDKAVELLVKGYVAN